MSWVRCASSIYPWEAEEKHLYSLYQKDYYIEVECVVSVSAAPIYFNVLYLCNIICIFVVDTYDVPMLTHIPLLKNLIAVLSESVVAV